MDWIKRLNQALQYVEEHLDEELNIEEIAEKAYTSCFHFQRMFSMLSGITIAEHIRRRRITLAAKEIKSGEEILATAIKYGYESQASFTRAFQRLQGFTPGKTREEGVKIKAYPPLSFQLTIKGAQSMDYEIKKVEAMTIAGYKRRFTSKGGQNFVDIPQFWQEVENNGQLKSMKSHANEGGILKGATLGVCIDFSDEQEVFDYMVAMEPKDPKDLKGLELQEIPPLTWAIFKGAGKMPEAIQKVWHSIFHEWFPATDYIHEDAPEMEVYGKDQPDGTVPFEIWIPVRKAK